MPNIQANFQLPSELMDELRAMAPRGKLSAIVSQALAHELQRLRFRQALNESFGAWKIEAHPELSHGTDAYIRASRKSSRSGKVKR